MSADPGRELLLGSYANNGKVFRSGDTVLRPVSPHSAATTTLLRALADRSFPAPVPLGVDADGTQVFRWIAGDVAVSGRPAWVMNDAALFSVGQLLRTYHDTVATLNLASDLVWSDEAADPEGGDIICHNDLGPTNVVFRDGTAFALLDFDFAAPGRRVWDLAVLCRQWLRLRLEPSELTGAARRLIGLLECAPWSRDTDYQPAITTHWSQPSRNIQARQRVRSPPCRGGRARLHHHVENTRR